MSSESQEIFTANRLLARTINFGHALDGFVVNGQHVSLDPRHFMVCREAGFTAIRLPIAWAAHAATSPPYTIAPTVFDWVDRAVEEATSHGLAIILDNHLDPELMADPPAYRERFLTIAQQVADHYMGAPASVMLEPLAEPVGKLDLIWNEYLADVLTVIRASNPTRPVIVGPTTYNNARFLETLRLPVADRHLIVTFHQYWPIQFTMQGETWLPSGDPQAWLGTTWDGTDRERHELSQGFDRIAAWGKAHDRPIFMGEFGATSHADMPSRVRWTRFNREEAEQHEFSWGYWSFVLSFAVYDLQDDRWQQELLAALIA